jgi:hypothetical protein
MADARNTRNKNSEHEITKYCTDPPLYLLLSSLGQLFSEATYPEGRITTVKIP